MIFSNVAVAELQFKTYEVGTQTIAYYDTGTQTDEVIVLIHGNSSSSLSFIKQLTSKMADKYRIIALDMPGHGESRPLSVENLTFKGLSSVMQRFLTENGFDSGIIGGWSLGGHFLLEMANDLPNAKGFFIWGTPPVANAADMADAFLPNPVQNYGFSNELTQEQKDEYVTAFFRNGYKVPFSFRHDIRISDGSVRSAVGASLAYGEFSDERAVVASMNVPLMIIQGEYEGFVNPAYLENLNAPTLWQDKIHYIDNAGHTPQFETGRAFNRLVRKFAKDIFANY